jgi:Mor family transcriptional regulator
MTGGARRRRFTHLVDDIVTYGVRHLVELGMPEADARAAMRTVAHGVCSANAKCLIYVPADLDFELDARDLAIWQAYQVAGPTGTRPCSGERVQELAAEHGVSIQWIYQIVRRMHRAEIIKRQGVLPGIDPAE